MFKSDAEVIAPVVPCSDFRFKIFQMKKTTSMHSISILLGLICLLTASLTMPNISLNAQLNKSVELNEVYAFVYGTGSMASDSNAKLSTHSTVSIDLKGGYRGLLKQLSGRDFGFDEAKWRKWLVAI